MKNKFILLAFTTFLLTGCHSSNNRVVTNLLENKSVSEKKDENDFEHYGRPKVPIDDWKKSYAKTKEELLKNKKLWQEKSVKNYSFVAARYGGGTTNPWDRVPVLVKVSDGNSSFNFKEDVSEKKQDAEKFGVSHLYNINWVNEIDNIEKLYDYSLKMLEKGYLIDLEINKKLNYPKFVGITFCYGDHCTNSIQVSEFKVDE